MSPRRRVPRIRTLIRRRTTTPAHSACRLPAVLATAVMAAVLLAATVLAGISSAQAQPDGRADATIPARRLTHLGYRHVLMTCTHRGIRITCRWQGERGGVRCSGVATAVKQGRILTRVAIRRRSCRAAATGAVAPGKTRVSATPVVRRPTPTAPVVIQPTPRGPSGGGTSGGVVAVSNPQLGFNTYTTARTVAEQRELGATVSRLFVDWTLVEPSPGQWNWQQTDGAYAAMVAAGLKPLVVVYTAPCWARPSTDCSNPAFTGPPDPAS